MHEPLVLNGHSLVG